MKNLPIIIIALVLVGGGIWVFSSRQNTVTPTQTSNQKQNVETAPPVNTSASTSISAEKTKPVAPGLTMSDVAKHSNATSCYTIVSDKVYDLTNWISEHPGGEGAILSICGKNGTSAFMAQHGDSRKVAQVLASFLIGNLTK